MKKYTIAFLLTVLIVLLTACEEQAPEETETPTTGRSFVGGTEGIELRFMGGAPPTEVYDSNFEFDINVRLENVGEQNLAAGDVNLKITGIDPSDFGQTALEDTNADELISMRLDPQGNIVEGGRTNIDFAGLQAEEVTGQVQFNIRAEACYPYGTITISQLCILEDLLGTTRKAGEESFCNPNEEKTVENSGAPVQITGLKQSVIGKDKISFTFDIEQVGVIEGRTVYRKDSDCAATISNKNKVNVKVISDIDGTLTCTGLSGQTEGEVTLFSETESEAPRRSIVCTQTINSPGDFEKPLRIELEYDYKQYIDVPLIVKHIEE